MPLLALPVLWTVHAAAASAFVGPVGPRAGAATGTSPDREPPTAGNGFSREDVRSLLRHRQIAGSALDLGSREKYESDGEDKGRALAVDPADGDMTLAGALIAIVTAAVLHIRCISLLPSHFSGSCFPPTMRNPRTPPRFNRFMVASTSRCGSITATPE